METVWAAAGIGAVAGFVLGGFVEWLDRRDVSRSMAKIRKASKEI